MWIRISRNWMVKLILLLRKENDNDLEWLADVFEKNIKKHNWLDEHLPKELK